MLNFELLNGFVVDLTTEDLVRREYDYIKRNLDPSIWADENNWKEKREIVIEYYIWNYEYVFLKSPNVLQICESELFADSTNRIAINELKKVLEFMKNRDAWGFCPSFKQIKMTITKQIRALEVEKDVNG